MAKNSELDQVEAALPTPLEEEKPALITTASEQHINATAAAVDTGVKFRDVQENAIEAELFEVGLTKWQAVKLYRKPSQAICWAFIACLSIIMEGYDTSVTSNNNALPAFQKYFGEYYPNIDQYQIPAQWQTALGQAAFVGNIIGIPVGAYLIERLGYRYALMLNYATIMPFIAIQAFAKNLPMLFAGGLLTGLPFGVFSTLGIGYASEVCPLKLRGYFAGWINICWVIGIMFGTGIANVIYQAKTIWGVRAGYMSQWIWPIPLFFLMWMAPEAPWWLVRKNRIADAEAALKRLTSPSVHAIVPQLAQSMVRTYQLEVDTTSGARWIDCFKGPDRRRTEIGCMAHICQVLSGDPFCGQPVYVLQQFGLSNDWAFLLGFINWIFVLIGCIFAYILMGPFGRRKLYLTGMSTLMLGLLVLGGMQKAQFKHENVKWGMYVVLVFWNSWRVAFIGPECYCTVGEASSSRLRNKSIALARITYQITNICFQFLEPWLINPSALNLKGYTAFVWAPICGVGLIWTYFRFPEFKDRSVYELDVLFERRISARKFAKSEVEGLADDEIRNRRNIAQHI